MELPGPESATAAPELDLPQTFERRAYVRYARRLEGLWQFLGIESPDLTDGTLFDLSVTGVGLVISRPFALGTTLLIRLPSSTLGWITHLGRVRRCSPDGSGRFQVGCQFVKPLSVKQLQAYLKPVARPASDQI